MNNKMKIAVLSDTHGLVREQVQEMIGECDAIIHAGDINSQKILDEIVEAGREKVPFYVVRGNNDKDWAKEIPETLQFELQHVKFFLVHNKKDIPENLSDIQIIIYGHSHKYSEEEKEGRLWLNPGSCGKRRFHQPITMAILTLEDEKWEVERIDILHEQQEGKEVPSTKITQRDLAAVIPKILTGMEKGQTVEQMAKKLGVDSEFVEEICRIRVTHPGVTVDGIMNKIEVNAVVGASKDLN